MSRRDLGPGFVLYAATPARKRHWPPSLAVLLGVLALAAWVLL